MNSWKYARHAGTAALFVACTLLAQHALAAAIIVGPVTVTQREDGFADLVNVVNVVNGGTAEIQQGDGSEIGDFYMQDGEFIDINSPTGTNTILFSLKNTGTGSDFAPSAQYLFTGIPFSAAAHIDGVTVSSPDGLVTSFLTAVTFTANSITLALGGLDVTANANTNNLGKLLLTVNVVDDGGPTTTTGTTTTGTTTTGTTGNVPEPSVAVLAGAAVVLAYWRIRHRNA